MIRALNEAGGNPGRSGHRLALHAAEVILECREHLAQLFNISNPLRICFTSNATESLNLALKGLLRPGDHVVCSSMEHNSVWRPLCQLQKNGVQFSIAKADPLGRIYVDSITREVRPQTRLIAIIHASNVSGTLNPIREIGQAARNQGIAFLVDAAQTAGSVPIDVEAMNIDMLAFPGHKGLLGPTGTGGLYIRETIELEPLKEGGTGSESASPGQPGYLPDRYESGTLNAVGIAGLNEGIRYLLREGVAAIQCREGTLTRRLIGGLSNIPAVTVYGPGIDHERAAVASFNLIGRDPVWLSEQLDRDFGIACRPGLHCAYLAHRTLGTARIGTVRLSPGPFTTEQEIDNAVEAVMALSQRT
jgi:cysteine desulfurase family protein